MSRMSGFGPRRSGGEGESGAVSPLHALAAALVALVAALALSLAHTVAGAQPSADTAEAAELPVVYDTPAVTETRTDGPIYDLPDDVSQAIVCDRLNREYLLLTTEQGGVCLVPYLDEDGEQAVAPRS